MSQCENQAIGINSVSALGLCTFKIMTWAQKQQWLSQRKDDTRRILRLVASAKLFSKDLAQLRQNICALRNTINSFNVNACMYVLCVWMHVEARSPYQVSSSMSLLIILGGKVFQWTWSTQIQLDWLVSELHGISCLHLRSVGITNTQVLKFAWQVLYQLSHLPDSKLKSLLMISSFWSQVSKLAGMTESQVPENLDLFWVQQHIPSRTFHELSKVIFPESTRKVLQLQIASCHLTTNS